MRRGTVSTKEVTDLHIERGDLHLEVVEELDTAEQFFKSPVFIFVTLSLGGWFLFLLYSASRCLKLAAK